MFWAGLGQEEARRWRGGEGASGRSQQGAGEVIAGRRRLLHMDVVERIANGLRNPGHMLGLARRVWETPQALVITEREAPQAPEPEQQTPVSLPGPEGTASWLWPPERASAQPHLKRSDPPSRTTGVGMTSTARE